MDVPWAPSVQPTTALPGICPIYLFNIIRPFGEFSIVYVHRVRLSWQQRAVGSTRFRPPGGRLLLETLSRVVDKFRNRLPWTCQVVWLSSPVLDLSSNLSDRHDIPSEPPSPILFPPCCRCLKDIVSDKNLLYLPLEKKYTADMLKDPKAQNQGMSPIPMTENFKSEAKQQAVLSILQILGCIHAIRQLTGAWYVH